MRKALAPCDGNALPHVVARALKMSTSLPRTPATSNVATRSSSSGGSRNPCLPLDATVDSPTMLREIEDLLRSPTEIAAQGAVQYIGKKETDGVAATVVSPLDQDRRWAALGAACSPVPSPLSEGLPPIRRAAAAAAGRHFPVRGMAQNVRGAEHFLSPSTVAIASIDSELDRYNLLLSPVARLRPPPPPPPPCSMASALVAATTAGYGSAENRVVEKGYGGGYGGGETRGDATACRGAVGVLWACTAAVAARLCGLGPFSASAADGTSHSNASACEVELVGGYGPGHMSMERDTGACGGCCVERMPLL